MADEQFVVELKIDLNAKDLRAELSTALGGLNESVTGFDKKIAGVQSGLDGVTKSTQATRGVSQSLVSDWKNQLQAGGFLKTNMENLSQQTAIYNQYLFDEEKAVQRKLASQGKQAAADDRAIGQRDAHVQAFNRFNAAQESASKQTALYNQYLFDQDKAAQKAAASQERLSKGLSTTRYALYDVSSTLTILGAGLLAVAVGTQAVAIAWERDFANVVRTSGVVGDEVGKLRAQFVDLAQALPASFGDITKIGTLGSQLGVARKDLAAFTETVLKFSAATGISAEESAQAFGRLGNILGIGSQQYDNLGSSIVKAGLAAVATESEIVAVAQQIGPIARLAGASASEVIGLATAFASVKIPPELARSVITKTFGDIQMAVATASPKLEQFGKVTGQSGKEFAAAWNKDSTGAFLNLLQGIPKDANGAILALDGMGLSSQRNTPALLKLAQNTDLVRKSLRDAKTGFDENTELSRQFGVISETTAAKLQILANNFQALLDAIGSANLGPINDILDSLSGFLGFLTDVASTDVGGQILGWAAALTALAGVLAIVGGGFALFGASSIGMLQALEGIAIIAPRATGAILGTGTASALAAGEMRAGALSAKLLGTALKALGLITLVLALPDIAKWASDGIYALKGFDTSTSETFKRVKTAFEGDTFGNLDISGLNGFTAGVQRFFAAFDEGGVKDVQRTDEAISELAKGGNIKGAAEQLDVLRSQWEASGGSLEAFNSLFPDATKALGDYQTLAGENDGTEKLNEDLQATQDEAKATEDALNALKDAILNFGNASISVEESQIRLSQAFNAMTEAAGAEGASLTGANAASLELRQSYIDIDKAARDAAIAIIENGGSVDEATAKYNESREAIIQSRIAKGEDEAAARAWADKVLGSAADAEGAIRNYAGSYNAVPKDVYTAIHVTGASAAYDEIMTVQRYLNTLPGVKNVRIAVGAGGQGGLTVATGGYISGPGSGTSDSIPARLSNGEYVIKAAAVKAFGVNYFHALNQGRKPRGFASGGAVNVAPSAPSMMGGVVELGPRSLAAVSNSVTNQIFIDDMAISRAAQRGDEKRRSTGDL